MLAGSWRLAICIPMIAVVLLTGCSGGGGGDDDPPSDDRSQASGSVVKGILDQAIVTLRPLSNGAAGDAFDSVRTDSQGRYSVRFPADAVGPFLLEASSDASTRMRCDLNQGCGPANGDAGDTNKNGITDFGEWGPAPPLTLSALASTRTMLEGMTITPFTHLAARYAATAPQGQDAVSAEVSYSQISRALGLQTSLGTLRAFDLFAPPATASLEQWQYSLLIAAIASVAVGDAAIAGLGSTLSGFAGDFAANGGQFPLKKSDVPKLSIETLFTSALSLAQRVKPEAAPLFSLRLEETRQGGVGEFTQARPDASAGQETLTKVNSFLAAWRQWRMELPLPEDGPPLADTQKTTFQPDLDAHWTLTRALAAVSPIAPQTTQPDVLLRSACSALTNSFNRFLCNSLAGNPRNLCLLNLSINGETFCDYLTRIRVPTIEGLTAEANVFDRTAKIRGTLDDWTVDLLLSGGVSKDKSIQMVVAGTVSSDKQLWTLKEGSMTFDYAEAITSANIRKPNPVKAQFKLDHSASSPSGPVAGSFSTSLTMDAIALGEKLAKAPSYETALPDSNLDLQSVGRQTSPQQGDASISLKGGASPLIRIKRPVVVTTVGLASTIILSGAPARWRSGMLDAEVEWADGRWAASYPGSSVELKGPGDMRAVLPESPGTGSLYLGNQRVGALSKDGAAAWRVKRPDFLEETL
jgi:hypothetical protein